MTGNGRSQVVLRVSSSDYDVACVRAHLGGLLRLEGLCQAGCLHVCSWFKVESVNRWRIEVWQALMAADPA
jgi:hypothetical protein